MTTPPTSPSGSGHGDIDDHLGRMGRPGRQKGMARQTGEELKGDEKLTSPGDRDKVSIKE